MPTPTEVAPGFRLSETAILTAGINWLEMAPGEFPALLQFNKPLGLSAMDPGHLFVFSRAVLAEPEIHLVTFDKEMRQAAKRCHLPRLDSDPG